MVDWDSYNVELVKVGKDVEGCWFDRVVGDRGQFLDRVKKREICT